MIIAIIPVTFAVKSTVSPVPAIQVMSEAPAAAPFAAQMQIVTATSARRQDIPELARLQPFPILTVEMETQMPTPVRPLVPQARLPVRVQPVRVLPAMITTAVLQAVRAQIAVHYITPITVTGKQTVAQTLTSSKERSIFSTGQTV